MTRRVAPGTAPLKNRTGSLASSACAPHADTRVAKDQDLAGRGRVLLLGPKVVLLGPKKSRMHLTGVGLRIGHGHVQTGPEERRIEKDKGDEPKHQLCQDARNRSSSWRAGCWLSHGDGAGFRRHRGYLAPASASLATSDAVVQRASREKGALPLGTADGAPGARMVAIDGAVVTAR